MLLSLKLFSSPFFNLVIFLTFEMETQKLGMMEITDFSAFLVSNIKFSKLRVFFFSISKLYSMMLELLLCKWHFPSPNGLHSANRGSWRKTARLEKEEGHHSFLSPCSPVSISPATMASHPSSTQKHLILFNSPGPASWSFLSHLSRLHIASLPWSKVSDFFPLLPQP